MRYLPLTDDDRRAMLSAIGVATVDELFRDVPAAARLAGPVDLPSHAGELEVERRFGAMARKNVSPADVPCFLGAGIYRHHIPATVDHLIQRSEFLTAYTPYQPEVSQGTLQYLFEFQTQVAMITGMDVANASMYDGATAFAESVIMACRATRRNRVVISGGVHPHYRDVLRTYGGFLGLEVDLKGPDWQGAEDLAAAVDAGTACVAVQNPDFFGRVRDLSALAQACQGKGALLVVTVTEPVSLGLLRSPGEMGADIVAAEGQGLGGAPSFGGPTVGLMAAKTKFVRQLPGRLVGQTTDVEGRRGFVLTLSTREQHIRREKATSNICTNSGLCALAFTIHLSLLGEAGFRRLAQVNHAVAASVAERLGRVPGLAVLSDTFFNEFTVRLPKKADAVVEALAERGVLGGVPVSRFYPDHPDVENLLVVAASELNTPDDAEALAGALREVL